MGRMIRGGVPLGKIFSIDVGTKNLAYCLYDPQVKRILQWESVAPAGIKTQIVHSSVSFLHQFRNDVDHLVQQADHVLIERQMASRMRIIEAVLYSLYFDKADLIAPRSVRAWMRSEYPDMVSPAPAVAAGKGTKKSNAMKEYRKGKQESVALARLLVQQQVEDGTSWLNVFQDTKKQDDLSDCFLQALYYVHSKQ